VRPFVVSGIIPYFALQPPTSGFVPNPLWKVVSTEPNQNIANLPAAIPFKWRAIAGATEYQVGYVDGRHWSAPNYLAPVSRSSAGCPFGTGICSVSVPVCTTVNPPPTTPCIYRGKGKWFVKGLSDAAPDSNEWSPTQVNWGTLLPAPTSPQTITAAARPRLGWAAVANATHYQIWINDSQGPSPKVLASFTRAQTACDTGSQCEITIPADQPELAPGSATWWVEANCSDHWSAAVPFQVPPPP
jgi:hypothetical protein